MSPVAPSLPTSLSPPEMTLKASSITSDFHTRHFRWLSEPVHIHLRHSGSWAHFNLELFCWCQIRLIEMPAVATKEIA